jgi:undecaprenyl-diphosphatase
MEIILWYDRIIFQFINGYFINPIFDFLMPFISERNNWILLYVFLWFFLIIKGGKKGKIFVILIIFAIIASDQISSSILKPLVNRLRPCHELEGVRILVGCGGKLGFPSSHAANYFAAATLFTYYFPKYKWIYIIIAILVAYSRIYIGVHYPLDVIFGALLGFLCSLILIIIYNNLEKFYLRFKTILKKVSVD